MSREWEANRSGDRGERRWGAREPLHSEQSGPRQPREREVEGSRERDRGRARSGDGNCESIKSDRGRFRGRGRTELAEGRSAPMLAHERLDVYQVAIEFLALAAQTIEALPRGYSGVSDQLRRASLSVPLNIAEGVGKTTKTDRARFYSIARGSAMECGAVFDALGVMGLVEPKIHERGKQLLVRISSMLTKMCLP